MIDKKYLVTYTNNKFFGTDENIVNNVIDITLKYDNDNPIETIDVILENVFYSTIKICKDIDPYSYYFIDKYTKLLSDDKSYLNDSILKEVYKNLNLDYFITNLKKSNLEIILLDENSTYKTYLIIDYFVCDKKLAPLQTKDWDDEDIPF